MTREEAKHIVDVTYTVPLSVRRAGEDRTYYQDEISEAKNMAIQALSQEPICDRDCEHCTWTECPIEPCTDAVSRQAVLKELKESAEHHANDSREEALLRRDRDIIRALPSVTQKSGKWINKDFRKEEYVLTGKCSVCGRVRILDKFCSYCGAKMESEE